MIVLHCFSYLCSSLWCFLCPQLSSFLSSSVTKEARARVRPGGRGPVQAASCLRRCPLPEDTQMAAPTHICFSDFPETAWVLVTCSQPMTASWPGMSGSSWPQPTAPGLGAEFLFQAQCGHFFLMPPSPGPVWHLGEHCIPTGQLNI